MGFVRAPVRFVRSLTWVDVLLTFGVCVLIYAFVGVAQEWAGPYRPRTEIDLSFGSLFFYSIFSLVRVFAAYALSLLFTFTYGYWAAKSKKAEPILISLLDIMQSVPVLGYMPGLVLALVNIFPRSNLGLELAAVVMVFTCEGWNMVFSFYSSLKTVPGELRDMASVFRMRNRDVLYRIEIPYAMNGLIWNSMLSMAGGWFYIMVMESFSLGDKDFRLPGIGSYMAVAYERQDTRAIMAGIFVMFILIFVVDRCLWAPLVAWSERFRYERDNPQAPQSFVLDLLKRSRLLSVHSEWVKSIQSWWTKRKGKVFEALPIPPFGSEVRTVAWRAARWVGVGIGVLAVLYGIRSMYLLLSASTWLDWAVHLRDTFLTFLRVMVAVVLGSLWTIPVGVFIGMHPKWTKRLQPVVQVVASFPAPMVFPVITYLLVVSGIGIEIGSVVLMLFASQWYILFNVISGATLIPQSMIDVASAFQVRGWPYWRAILIPAIFPSLVNGWITAAGGAWNSCIVSEFVMYGGSTMTATGIGGSISVATQAADFPRLAGATVTMITVVVLLNRFFWGALYRLAETRFRIE